MIWTIPPLTPTSFLITWELCVPGALPRPVSHLTLSYQRERQRKGAEWGVMFGRRGTNRLKAHICRNSKYMKQDVRTFKLLWKTDFVHRYFTYSSLPHTQINQLQMKDWILCMHVWNHKSVSPQSRQGTLNASVSCLLWVNYRPKYWVKPFTLNHKCLGTNTLCHQDDVTGVKINGQSIMPEYPTWDKLHCITLREWQWLCF